MLVNHTSKIKSLILIVLLSMSCHNLSAEETILDYFFDDITFTNQPNKMRFQQLQNHLRNSQIEQAVQLAEDLVDQHIDLSESHPIRFGKLLSNLGILLSYQGYFADAMTSLDPALDFIEQRSNPFSSTILKVTMARGLTLAEMDQFEGAEESFRRAQHISHRTWGVYTPAQLEIVNHITRLNLRQGLYSDADREQNFNLRISEQAYGKSSEEIIPILERLGGYFATRGSMIPLYTNGTDFRYYRDSLFRQSLTMYRRAIKIIEDNHGVNDMRLVEPLRGLARARLLQITNRGASEDALERALRIVESNPDTDVPDRVRAMIHLGDIYTITSDGRARDIYIKAWNAMQDNPDYDELKAELFGTPTRLHPEISGVLYLKRKPDAAVTPDTELYIDVSYSVKANGHVGNIRLIDKNVPNAQVRYIRSQLADTRFRPRIFDGEPVTTENLMIHQIFKVLGDQPIESNITIGQTGGQ